MDGLFKNTYIFGVCMCTRCSGNNSSNHRPFFVFFWTHFFLEQKYNTKQRHTNLLYVDYFIVHSYIVCFVRLCASIYWPWSGKPARIIAGPNELSRTFRLSAPAITTSVHTSSLPAFMPCCCCRLCMQPKTCTERWPKYVHTYIDMNMRTVEEFGRHYRWMKTMMATPDHKMIKRWVTKHFIWFNAVVVVAHRSTNTLHMPFDWSLASLTMLLPHRTTLFSIPPFPFPFRIVSNISCSPQWRISLGHDDDAAAIHCIYSAHYSGRLHGHLSLSLSASLWIDKNESFCARGICAQ